MAFVVTGVGEVGGGGAAKMLRQVEPLNVCIFCICPILQTEWQHLKLENVPVEPLAVTS